MPAQGNRDRPVQVQVSEQQADARVGVATSRLSTSFILTGQRIEGHDTALRDLYLRAREVCAEDFPAEETRELKALYAHIALGLVDEIADQLATRLALPRAVFRRDRFSAHGCGPVGLHDDFFRFPSVYFVVVVAHCGDLGLVDGNGIARRHQAGDIILLDPRRKHALVRTGARADDHVYDVRHAPVYEPENQFLFLDFDLSRPELRHRFRRRPDEGKPLSGNS